MKKALKIIEFIGTPQGKRDVGLVVTAISTITTVLKQFGVI
jgi:hypothetical protein